MTCPRCKNAVVPGSVFCMYCGQILPQAATPGGAVAIPMRKPIWLGVGIGAAIVLLALIGLGAAGVLRLGGNIAPAQTLEARGSVPGPGLAKDAKLDEPIEMPADIRDWLEHLRITDEKKNVLHAKQTADAAVFADLLKTLGVGVGAMGPDGDVDVDKIGEPNKTAEEKIKDYRPDWQNLLTFFGSKKPPLECQPIANQYDQALREVSSMQGDLQEIMKTVSTDPQAALSKLYEMKGKSGDAIDKHFKQTDDLVQEICDKYHTKKWFDIKPDLAGGSLAGLGL